jgi:hypothetical protein
MIVHCVARLGYSSCIATKSVVRGPIAGCNSLQASSSASAGLRFPTAVALRRRPVRRDLIGQNTNAIAALQGAGCARERHRLRAIGPRPRVRHQRQRYFVHAFPELDAEPLMRPERGGVADRCQGKRPRELERVALVTCIPIGEANLPADGARLVASGNRLDQVSDIGIDAVMPVVVATPSSTTSRGPRRNASSDACRAILDGIPVRGRPLAMQQPGFADYLGADADAMMIAFLAAWS